MQSSDKAEPLLQPRQPSRRFAMLGCCYCIFLVQYAVQFMISPFFPTSPAGEAIGIRLVGAVFAAYPLATACATPIVPAVLRAFGMRRAIPGGLCVTALGSLLFGLLPSFVSSPLALSVGLLSFRCLGGLGAAVSESGCLTLISTGEAAEEEGRLGVALSSVEVCTGVGAAAGTALGGLLFSLGGATPFGEFLFPFVVGAALPLSLVPLCWHALKTRPPPAPQSASAAAEAAVGGGGGGRRRSPLYQRRELLRRLPTAVSVVACAAVCEALNPILSPQMLRRFDLDAGKVGLLFSLMCAGYMLGALPVGALTDRWSAGPRGGRRLLLLVSSGYLCMVLGYVLLGPLSDRLWAGGSAPGASRALFVSAAALPLLGGGAAVMIMPTLPDLQRGLPAGDEEGRSACCALWNGLYSIGSVVGPLASASLYYSLGWLATTQLVAAFCAALAAALALAAFCGDRWLLLEHAGHGSWHNAKPDGWKPCPEVAGALVRVEAGP